MTFNRKKYKEFALMQLRGRWKVAVFGTLISIILLTVFSFTQKQTSNINFYELMNYSYDQLLTYLQNSPAYSVPGTVLSIIETIIGYVVEIVLVSFFLIFSRSPDPVFMKNYFEGYNKWARGILCGLWRLLWTTLWALIAIPVGILYLLIITISGIDATSGITTTLFFVVLIIGLIPMFIKTIEYSFAFFFVSEFPELGIRKALRHSITITKGHRWDIFVLDLSFIGWFLLGCLSIGVAFLWILPYYYMTLVNTYHALLQNALEKEIIKPEDLN